jgi:hypothetical protein
MLTAAGRAEIVEPTPKQRRGCNAYAHKGFTVAEVDSEGQQAKGLTP